MAGRRQTQGGAVLKKVCLYTIAKCAQTNNQTNKGHVTGDA